MPEYARTVHARGHCNSQSGMHSSAQTQPGATNRNAINNDINNDFDNMMLLRACKRKSGVAQILTLTETLSESCHLSELHTARYKYYIVTDYQHAHGKIALMAYRQTYWWSGSDLREWEWELEGARPCRV